MCTSSDSPGDVVIVVEYTMNMCMVSYGCSWFDCSFSTACLRVITQTALHTTGVFIYFVHDCRAFRTVRAVIQRATNRCTYW